MRPRVYRHDCTWWVAWGWINPYVFDPRHDHTRPLYRVRFNTWTDALAFADHVARHQEDE